jgi:hypothetical protein
MYLQFVLCLKKKALLLAFARAFAGRAGWLWTTWLLLVSALEGA